MENATTAGSLPVAYLKDYWSRSMARTPAPDLWQRDQLLIHGLGIGLEQTARYLSTPRSFEEFEAWIVERNGGALDPARVRRLNAALLGEPYDEATQRWLASIEEAAPVLDDRELATWRDEGYVIVHRAISLEEAVAAAEVVYATIGALRDDPDTWYGRRNMQGIMVQLFQHPAFETARRSPRVHKAFAQLWGTADLFPTTDRCGFNPPERAGFPFPGPRLHLDLDAAPPVPLGAQGIVYLTDTEAEQGAFTCIPGFHHEIDGWLARLPRGAAPEDHFPAERARPIPGAAGDLVIWHHALPHGSRPNRTRKPRVVQYLTMFPPPRVTAAASTRRPTPPAAPPSR